MWNVPKGDKHWVVKFSYWKKKTPTFFWQILAQISGNFRARLCKISGPTSRLVSWASRSSRHQTLVCYCLFPQEHGRGRAYTAGPTTRLQWLLGSKALCMNLSRIFKSQSQESGGTLCQIHSCAELELDWVPATQQKINQKMPPADPLQVLTYWFAWSALWRPRTRTRQQCGDSSYICRQKDCKPMDTK